MYWNIQAENLLPNRLHSLVVFIIQNIEVEFRVCLTLDPSMSAPEPSFDLPRDEICWNDATYILSADPRDNHDCCCAPGNPTSAKHFLSGDALEWTRVSKLQPISSLECKLIL